MFKSIIVLVERNSVPYCYYEVGEAECAGNVMVPFEGLKNTINHAVENDLVLNVVYGHNSLPENYRKELAAVPHIGIYPFLHPDIGENDLTIMCEKDVQYLSKAKGNIVIRIHWESVNRIPDMVRMIHAKIRKCNFHILPPEKMAEEDIKKYRDVLIATVPLIVHKIQSSLSAEVNIVTDRVLLGEMQNCSAGVDHVTLAPNGKFYVCPGFYYRDEKDSIGNDIEDIKIPNGQLFTLEKSPICSNCDAYHCKRCVYLNKTRTLEVNTPSREQCVISHLEREATRNFIEQAGMAGLSWNVAPILPLDYLDPMEIIKNHKTPPFKMKNYSAGAPPTSEDRRLLFQILEQQKDILRRLERLEKERK